MFNLLLKIIKNEGFLKIQKMYKAYVKKACMFFILQSKLGYALHMQNTMTGRNIGQKSAFDTDLLNVSNSAILHDLCRRGQYSVRSPFDNHEEEQQIYVIT